MLNSKARADRVLMAAMLACCTASMVASGPLTAASPPRDVPSAVADVLFSRPYVDIDEWRRLPVPHRYVHGGFTGTGTRFSIYLPPKSQYHGRFFQHFTPTPDSENLAQHVPAGEENKIGFAIASGGYFVETNGGGDAATGGPGFNTDPTIAAFRANAAAAQYSRVIALRMYGGHRPFGYAYGGSGGAYRTVGAFENTRGVWDGVVPYVLGSPMASPSNFTVRMRALRVLRNRFPQIVDAVEPGGSGDPYAGLSGEEAAALREVTRMGFPIESWFGWKTMGVHAFPAIYGGVLAIDPDYFTDFWTKPGYLGFDHPEQIAGDRMQHRTVVTAAIGAAQAAAAGLNTRIVNGKVNGGVDDSFQSLQHGAGDRIAAFRLAAAPPPTYFAGGDLLIRSGAAKGKRLQVSRIAGDVVVLGIVDPALAASVRPGDAVQLDNSNYLAAETYHRHQVPGLDYPGWNQFRGPDGKPVYPQRPVLLGPLFTKGAAGTVPTGRWQGKMILVENLWDREAWPWQAVWYRAQVTANLGAATDDHFRLWYTDRALHGDNAAQEAPTETVSYLGVLHQALRDLAAWVERGVPPPRSTRFVVTDDTHVVVPASAAERAGVQPVVRLTVNGVEHAAVAPGATLRFDGMIEVPPRAGRIVAAEWDFDGSGTFAVKSAKAVGAKRAEVSLTRRFDGPGVYFVTLRGVSQRDGDAATPYARIANLARVRVVVR